MKKLISTVLCLFILLSCILPAMATTGVPEEVMESTKSVVRILSKYYNGATTGSGFVIKNEPGEVLIATNDHVVEGNPTSISIWVGEDRMVDAEIVFTTSEKDLCVLKVTDEVDMKPLKLSKEEPQHGAAIYVVGYPGAGDILSDTQAHTSDYVTITDGIISAIRIFTIEKGGSPVKLLQVNAAINSGNSGGPLFNTEGVVVGVNTYKVKADSQGVFGSVDISELWNLLDQYNIDIPEEFEIVETTEAPEIIEEPVEEPQKTSYLFPVVVCVSVVFLVLAVILIIRRNRESASQGKPNRKKVYAVTLQSYMEEYHQGLGISGAVSLLLPVAVQLRNLHNDGKLHLQICPHNILISADGASIQEPNSHETGRFNSGFAAPEIYKGAGFGITSDVYSFAALLLYVATGKVPSNSLQQEALEQDFDMFADTAFSGVLRKAMTANILDRTQSMQELIYSIAVYNAPVLEKPVPVQEETLQPVAERLEIENSGAEPIEPMQLDSQTDAVGDQSMDRCDDKEKLPCLSQLRNLPVRTRILVITLSVIILIEILLLVGLIPRMFGKRQEATIPSEITIPSETTHQTEWTTEETEIPADTLPQEEIQYRQAEQWEADGQIGRAAIAFGKLGDYSDARQRSFALWDKIAVRDTISAVNMCGTVGLRNDGTVLLTGGGPKTHNKQFWKEMQDDVKAWTDIIAVSSGFNVFGLKADGSVVVADPNEQYSEVEKWQDIVSISASDGGFILGLKTDGTVQIVYLENTSDETKSRLAWFPELSEWTDIVAVSTGTYHAAGLRADGTVIALGDPYHEKYWVGIEQWQNIVTIGTGESCDILGLKVDGTLVAVGPRQTNGDWHEKGKLDVSQWSDIAAFSVGRQQIIGVGADGTTVAVGYNWNGCTSVSKWTDIIAVDTGGCSYGYHTVGLRSDGTVVAVGDNTYGQCNVKDWKDIALPGQLSSKPESPHTDQQAQYDAAEKLLADGETAKAAIAFGKLGDYADARERSFVLWDEVAVRDTVAVGNHHTLGLKNNGTVVVAGQNIRHVGSAHRREVFPMPQGQGQCDVGDWSDIIAVAATGTCSVGLRADGTVVGAGLIGSDESGEIWKEIESWQDIVSITVGNGVIGLKMDGTVVSTSLDLSDWSDIVAISSGAVTLGLKADGDVLVAGNNYYKDAFNVEQWTDIVAIYAGDSSASGKAWTIGLQSDGTVVATGDNGDGQCNVEDWTDIRSVSVSSWERHITYGIKDDGTVLCAGKQSSWYNASKWKDIICIAAGRNHAVGLKYDGTLVATGNTEFGRCDVSGWTDIKLPN